MRNKFKNIVILFFLIVLFDNAIAQMKSPVINNVSFVYKNEQIEVTYDIIGYSSIDEFTISLSAFKGSGERFNVSTISGELNNVKGGLGKKIYWQQRKDGYVLDAQIYFILSATNKINVPLTSHLVKSVVFPGWGDNRLRNRKFHFIYGLAGYSLIATSIYMNQQAVKSYDNYKASFDIEKSNQLFNSAEKQQKLSYILAGSAALVWTIDLAGIYRKQHKLKNNITPGGSKYYYAKSQEQIVGKSPTQYINTKTSYDLAMERGDNYFKLEKYFDAKTAYEEAHALNKEEELPVAKLNTVNSILVEVKRKEITYNQKINEARELLDKKEYEKAKNSYKEAGDIKPKENFPIEKISEINAILLDIQKEARYKENIANGNLQATQGNYEGAKTYYENARAIKSNDPEATVLIDRMEDKLAALAVVKRNEEYSEKMAEANKEFNLGHYDQARFLYEQALNIKPSEQLPLTKIALCNEMIYQKLIVRAGAFYDKAQYDEARRLYLQASEINQNEKLPILRIADIDKKYENKIEESKKIDFKSIFNKNKDAVFVVYTSDGINDFQGTGFFITSTGIAISNYHVFKGTKVGKASIKTTDGKEYKLDPDFEIVKSAADDYIIFRVITNGTSFPSIKISGMPTEVADEICAIGNPKGLENTFTTGRVTGFRELSNGTKFIQNDVSITHGSSGGPLLNSKGEVIGITTMGQQEGSLFFAVDINELPLGKYVK